MNANKNICAFSIFLTAFALAGCAKALPECTDQIVKTKIADEIDAKITDEAHYFEAHELGSVFRQKIVGKNTHVTARFGEIVLLEENGHSRKCEMRINISYSPYNNENKIVGAVSEVVVIQENLDDKNKPVITTMGNAATKAMLLFDEGVLR